MPDFDSRDPTQPQFWSERFDQGFTPWDRGDVPMALQHFVRQSTRPLATLIPGCGSAYEVAFLAEAGWPVTAIDFSPAAVAAARAVLGPLAAHVVEADFFTHQPEQPLDVIYERAFLCALPRAMWPQVAERWAELLPAGGTLAGFFFFDDNRRGPPFGVSPEQLRDLIAPYFHMTDDDPVADSIDVFAGKERWQVWRRL
ncbi:MAG: methyltransferase domain-containing protein [Herminiimonas sp.]|nr:methyltransferase domain-containing protein [Herminiimonas sp.]